jgi:hypothetical protein
MTHPSTLGRQALRAALATRTKLNLDRASPACPFDAADRLGVEVKFRDETSMDGMYFRGSRPTILVSTHRPPGRRALTCAHELGHHVFGHGTRVDEVLDEVIAENATSPEERIANLFAGYFLMPKAAVEATLDARQLHPAQMSPLDVFRISCFFGVSFGGLVNHLCWSLDMISSSRLKSLLRVEPKHIKAELSGVSLNASVWPIDDAWVGRPVDVEVGDLIVAPSGVWHEGFAIDKKAHGIHECHFIASRPGISRLSKGGWNVFVRVQRAHFIGRSIFRYLDDPDAH